MTEKNEKIFLGCLLSSIWIKDLNIDNLFNLLFYLVFGALEPTKQRSHFPPVVASPHQTLKES